MFTIRFDMRAPAFGAATIDLYAAAIDLSHRVISVAEAVEIERDGGLLNLSPLCGGLPPDIGWPYLRRVAEVVLPEAAHAGAPSLSSTEGMPT